MVKLTLIHKVWNTFVKSLKRKKDVITLLTLALLFIDFSNIDRWLYKSSCTIFSNFFPMSCPDYFDIPIWEAGVVFGTIAAAYYAYAAIAEASKRLELDQAPYVVFTSKIIMSGNNPPRFHVVSLENIGKGRATNITISADDQNRLSIAEGSNSHSINLKDGEHNTGWGVDEEQVIKGLALQGREIVISVFSEIPDEMTLSEDEKEKSDIFLYLWYEDQIGIKYRTIGKFRHSGLFFKLMENRQEKL